MKKIFKLSLVLLLVVGFVTGCGKNNTKKEEKKLDLSVSEIVDKIYDGVDASEMPKVGNTEITSENMAYYLGVEDLDIKEGIASEAMIGSIAHSVVVVKVSDGVDIKQAKKDIKEKVNPRKWICVEAETVIVDSRDDVIILIMTNNDLATKVQANFKNL